MVATAGSTFRLEVRAARIEAAKEALARGEDKLKEAVAEIHAHVAAKGGKMTAVVVNSKNSNVATGKQGYDDCVKICKSVADQLGVPVMVAIEL